MITDVLIIILQMVATILIALEYYLDKKKLNKLETEFKINMNKANNDRKIDVKYRLRHHVKNKRKNIIIFVSSFFVSVIAIVLISLLIKMETIFDLKIFYVGMFIFIFLVVAFTIYFQKILDPVIEKLVTLILYEFPQNIILLAKKSVFVGLGIFFLLLSFMLALQEKLGFGVVYIKLFSIFIILIFLLYFSMFIKSYRKLN